MQRFLCRTQDVPNVDRAELQRQILDVVFQHGTSSRWSTACCQPAAKYVNERHCMCFTADMKPAYEAICQEQGWEVNQAQVARMADANCKRLEELEDKVKDAGTRELPLFLYSKISLKLQGEALCSS